MSIISPSLFYNMLYIQHNYCLNFPKRATNILAAAFLAVRNFFLQRHWCMPLRYWDWMSLQNTGACDVVKLGPKWQLKISSPSCQRLGNRTAATAWSSMTENPCIKPMLCWQMQNTTLARSLLPMLSLSSCWIYGRIKNVVCCTYTLPNFLVFVCFYIRFV